MLGVWGAAPSARGDVIFNNFGDGDTFVGWAANTVVWKSSPQSATFHAEQFVVGNEHSLGYTPDKVVVAIAKMAAIHTFNLSICLDNNGKPGGVAYVVSSNSASWPSSPEKTEIDITGPKTIPLLPGRKYWLVASLTADTEVTYNWYFNNGIMMGTMGDHAVKSYAGGSWGDWQVSSTPMIGVFRIEGTVIVPEPSTCMLFGLCSMIGGLGAWRRRRKRT